MKKFNVTTALAAVTLAAASLATPLSAQAQDYRNANCSDGSNAVLGAIAGGVAGAAIGDGVARRGQSTEIGILGAIIGGVAGAAVGDSISDCENRDRTNRRVTTTSYPTRTTSNRTYTSSNPVVYTSTSPVYRQNQGYTTSRPVYSTTVNYGHNSRNNVADRIYQIDRRIDDLCRELDYLKAQRRRSGRHHGVSRQVENLEYRIADLRRERKYLKKSSKRSNRSFRRSY